jgi:hypothetical protein
MIRPVIDLLRRFVAWVLSWFRRTETGGDVASYNDEDLIAEYTRDLAVGRSETSVDDAIQDGYKRLNGRANPPYRVVEIWAYGTNPFTEFRVIMKGDGTPS